MSKFRDQIFALVADDKKKDAEPLLAALDEQLTGYDNDIKTLKQTLREKDGIKPEDFAALEKENKELKERLSELDKSVKSLTKERDDATKKATETETALGSHLIDGGLASALNGKLKSPAYFDAVKSLLSRNFSIEADDKGARQAIAKVLKDGKETKVSVSDFVKDWLASDQGKEFALDQGGGGGGARGSGDHKPAISDKPFKDMSYSERMALHAANPTEYARLSTESGKA